MASVDFAPDSALTTDLRETARQQAVPGIIVGISRNGVREYAQVGVACLSRKRALSSDSLFDVSCFMKFFVSILVHRQITVGAIDPDAPIGGYIPELTGSCEVGARIQVKHLLSHTSGYRGPDVTDARTKWTYSWPQLVDLLTSQSLLFPPGWAFTYEHSEHVLLGEILQRVNQRKLSDILKEDLLEPLGIRLGPPAKNDQHNSNSIGRHVYSRQKQQFVPAFMPPFGKFWGASVSDSTIAFKDILTLGESLLAADGESLFLEMCRTAFEFPKQVAASGISEVLPESYGHLCAQYPRGLVGHNGSTWGQTMAIRIDPKCRVVIAVGVNAWICNARDRVITTTHARLSGEEYQAPRFSTAPVPFEIQELIGDMRLADVVGRYIGGYAGEMNIEAHDRGLIFRLGRPGASQQCVVMAPCGNGFYQLNTDLPFSFGFTSHPDDGTPVLLIGLNSFRKVA